MTMKRVLAASLLVLVLIFGGQGLSWANPTGLDLVSRIELIKTKMAKLRFCHNESCFYREITSEILPPQQNGEPYRATISAIIDRPSASPDKADYHFELTDQRWQLKSGEEYTDVADYSFVGDRYEIFSVHNNRNLHGDINQANLEGNLKSGYIALYFKVLDHGQEKSGV
ncbi:MAG: hypothetical protein SFT94_11315 [Pseudanabaenaceae cyanobacterium bins.68]|nr:hypothetical protein [Pseudanabaenaceae cyanobacterium bins.68]